MPVSDLHLFLNPAAGRGRAGRRLPRILELLAAEGLSPVVHASDAVGDLEARVLGAIDAGARQVLIAGGDGSVHEAANAALHSGVDVALGVIPTGTGNDFAKAAGITLDWEAATRLLADRIVSDASTRHIDAGRMNDRYFANGLGIGLDAKVTRIARAIRLPIGDVVYLLAIFRTMLDDIATPEVEISCDEFAFNGPMTLASISNGAWIGGMFHIAPMANNDDGKLELLVVAPVTRRRILVLLPKLIQGLHVGQPEISHASVTRVTISSAAPIESHLDGEVQPPATEFDIEILPDALRLI